MLATFESFDNTSRNEPPSLKEELVIGLERRTELQTLPVAKKQKSRSTHRVRFDLLPQVDSRRVELTTHEEKKLMWWNRSDIKKQARRDGLAYKDNGEESLSYVSKFHQALHLCSSNGRLENVPLISDVPVRGLEQCLFPDLIHARLLVVSKVLRAQRKLPAKISPEQQALLLGVVSKNLTRPSRRVARLLGIGDARVAADAQWMIDTSCP
jgi:hypothetical protein